MIYCNECFNCPLREKSIDPNTEKAKNFYHRTTTPFTFQCGAEFYPFHDVEPPFSAPTFSAKVEITPKKDVCYRYQYLKRKEESSKRIELESCKQKIKELEQNEIEKYERIACNRGPLSYEEVVLKWTSYLTSLCDYTLCVYYNDEDRAESIWDFFFEEQTWIERFLLDMMSENIKNTRDIIIAVYGETSHELFNYDLLLKTYKIHIE